VVAAAALGSSESDDFSPALTNTPNEKQHRKEDDATTFGVATTPSSPNASSDVEVLSTPHTFSSSHAEQSVDGVRVAVRRSDFEHYFGEEEIGDPYEELGDDDVRIFALEKMVQSRKPYSKVDKQKIFKDLLQLNKSTLLGSSPPKLIVDSFDMWSANSKTAYKSWEIPTVVGPMYDLGEYLHGRQAEGKLRSKAVALESFIVMYKHFHNVAKQEIAATKAKNKKILSQASGGTKKSKKGNLIPKHIDPVKAKRCSEFELCPECGCEGTIVEIYSEAELSDKQKLADADFAKRKEKNVNARKQTVQQEYACMCPRSRTWHGDWEHSSCLACRKRGKHDPECKNCNCNCTDETIE
jgi:hypothetical protein